MILSFKESEFIALMECMENRKTDIWSAPLVQILKYETERDNVTIKIKNIKNKSLLIDFSLNTEKTLYDQELTVLIPQKFITDKNEIFQGDDVLKLKQDAKNNFFINIKPVSGQIIIKY